MSVFQKISNMFQSHSRLAQLIIINFSIFLTVNLALNISHLDLSPYLILPVGGTEFLYKPWTIFTYMFVHFSFWHLFFNMALLFLAARFYFSIFGDGKLIYLYVMSGLSGAALILILGLLVPGSFFDTSMVGASCSAMGIVMVMATYSPNYKVALWGLFELKYKYFAILIFVVSTVVDFRINIGGKIAHLGGAAFGLIYGYSLSRKVDLFNFQFLAKKKSKLKVVSYNKTMDDVYNETRVSKELRMNELLDKISKSGYDSLTKKEKDELFNLSQKK